MKKGIKISRLNLASIIIIGIALIAILFFGLRPKKNYTASSVENQRQKQDKTTNNNEQKKLSETAETDKTAKIVNQPIKDKVVLAVPFTPQAPTGNWDELHNEACEEAAAIMANAYFSGTKPGLLPPKNVEAEITKLTKWQEDRQGYYLDQTTEEVSQMIKSVYSLDTSIIKNFTEQQLKQALSNGQLVLISADGRLLDNPNYKQPGPVHHMLVVTGYDEKGFITNDPGTKRGQSFRYSFNKLEGSAADWVHSRQTTDTNIKSGIIVGKAK